VFPGSPCRIQAGYKQEAGRIASVAHFRHQDKKSPGLSGARWIYCVLLYQFSHDLVLLDETYQLVCDNTILEDKESRDGHNRVLTGDIRRLVDIDLNDLDFTFYFSFNLLNDRIESLAGTAPGSPEINQDRDLGLENFGFEALAIYH
jgi:hypothetical protein